MKTLIQNGHVVDPANDFDALADVLVENGRIAKIGKNISESADKIIDAKNLLVTPGLVDLQVHFREPGREDRETIETGSRAAIAGGITSAVCMPNTTPTADNQSVISHVLRRARELDMISIFPAATSTQNQSGDQISEMADLKAAGAIAVTDDGFDVQNEALLLNVMKYARTHDILVMSHCEIESLSAASGMHEGWVSTQLGLPASPEISEDLAVIKNISCAEKSGARLHLLHLSTAGSVAAVAAAKKRGLKNITAEVSVQHFALTDEAVLGYNNNAKMYPPLRSENHRMAMIEAIKNDTIDAFTTDHAPHIEPDKIGSFETAAFGSTGVETSFAVAHTFLVAAGHISFSKMISKMTIEPARIIGVEKGTLSVGADADISIFDPKKKWKYDAKKSYSKGKNCVFDGHEFLGKCLHTMVRGKLKMENEIVLV